MSVRQIRPALAVGLVLVAGIFVHNGAALAEDAAESCEAHGTSVAFFSTPDKAAKQARKEEKLVFVLHVSGNFETPDYT